MRYERIIFNAALVLYIVSAWFSTGFYHGDEHYQIIEFAGYKMGNISMETLAWEFEAMVRPGIQPFLAFIVLIFLELISVSDPYIQVFILRLLTALFALFSIRYFTRSCQGMIRSEYHKIFLFISYFLWFLPWVNVRFSSESWSGIFLLIALSVCLNSHYRYGKFYLIGGLLGLSFLFRYQNAFLALGLVMWLIFIRKEKWSELVRLLAAGFVVLLLGILIDFWLYGQLTLSSWNYFYVNLVEDVASGYGTEKWWNYFYSIFRFSFFPIGIPILISFLLLTIKQPRNLLVWTILPFFIIHSIIPHKELRFLFPVVNLLPMILVLAYQELRWDLRKWNKIGAIAMKIVALSLLTVNCLAVVIVSLKPADGGLMRVTQYIHRNHGDQPIRLISYDHSNPYGPWGLMADFYREEDLLDIRLESLNELSDSLFHEDRVNLLVLKRINAESDHVQAFIYDHNVQKKIQCIPEWMEPLMTLYGGYHLEWIYELYEIPEKFPDL